MDLLEIADVFADNHGLPINAEHPQNPLRITYLETDATTLLVQRIIHGSIVECAVQVLNNLPLLHDKEIAVKVVSACIPDYISLLEKASTRGTHPLSRYMLARLKDSFRRYLPNEDYASYTITDFERHGVAYLLRDLYPSTKDRMIRP